MSLRAHHRPALSARHRARRRHNAVTAALAAVATVAAMLPLVGIGLASPAAAAGNELTIRPVNARSVLALGKGDAIPAGTHYTWLITADDVGDPTQSIADCVPGSDGATSPDPLRDTGNGRSFCQWPSLRTTPGNVPVIASGDDTTLNQTTSVTLPSGKYLVSVLADGYALGGAHVRIPAAGTLDVPVQPYPLPLATMKIQVFHDNAPVDGTFEVDGESGTNLAGFTAHLTDVLGEVTTDWFGNPLCTNYVHTAPDAQHPQGQVQFDADGSPVIDTANPGGACRSDATGLITVPNLGSNRYGVTVVKPADKADWVQTTTLEGGHDHDVWLMAGDTGNDTEMVVGGEPVPWVQFGFIEPKTSSSSATGHVKGQVLAGLTYVGGNGGITIPGGTGTAGGKEGPPIDRPWVALSDLGNGDQMVSVTRGDRSGVFDIGGVPDGTYQLTAWDDLQDYIIYSFNVTVSGGQTVDTGKTYLSGWVSRIYGTVFIDTNGNGRRDAGEQGVPRTAVTLRERDNSLMDQFQNTVTTDLNGNYAFTEAYPLTRWLVLEHFNTRYEGTGITFQGENDPTPTTLRGAAVDVNVLPVLGLGGRVDWGVRPYAKGTNGGIVGTVTYDSTRNELDPSQAVTESYQPGIPGVPVHLYPVLTDPATGKPVLDARGMEQKDTAHELTEPYISETWQAPKGCTPRQWDGSELHLAALPQGGTDLNYTCVESPASGHLVMPSDNTDGAFAQTVNGNYGFATSDLNLFAVGDTRNPGYPDPLPAGFTCPSDNATDCAAGKQDLPQYSRLADFGYDPQALVPGDYVVTVDLPNDAFGKPIYQVTREQDVNVFDGDEYLPQENFPPSTDASTGGNGVDTTPLSPPEAPPSQGGGLTSSACVGPANHVHVTDAAFADAGGSPFEGQDRALCTEKVVTVRAQQATAPNFSLFTQTPLPTHFWGLTINDLGLSWDKRSIQYGEAQGLPNVPMGIYDFSGNLVDSTTTDFNGFYEAIEPSTSSYNCPLPAGPCPGMYRFVGNDPGQPGQRNANYNPRYRTIATNFQAWPGLFTVTDTAPTQTGAVIITPGTTSPQPVVCDVAPTTPEVFAVSSPYVADGSVAQRTITVQGQGFGAYVAPAGGGSTGSRAELVPLGNGATLSVTPVAASWSDHAVTFQVPTSATNSQGGQYQLRIRNGGSGSWSSSAITLHVRGSAGLFAYRPTVVHVGPGQQYSSIQAAINAASTSLTANTLVLVHPGTPGTFNPDGAYLENPIVNRRIKLQGFGPGGTYADGTHVPGSVIDGQGFDADGASGTAWFALAGQQHAGPGGVPDGATVTVLPQNALQFLAPNGAAIDGLRITGGYQQDIAGNLNAITGANVTGFGAPGAAVTQGGGIYVHAAATGLRIANNLVIGNSGSYGGGIRVGTPYTPVNGLGALQNRNTNVAISYNRIRDNGGTNLAGGIGLFDGSNGYSVDHNDICGNFSAEYGGGVSHFGLSPNGTIDHNRLWFNESYDEGGGIMVAGELPADPNQISPGSGPVAVTNNEIVVNNANDDGGGLRFLQVNDAQMTVNNNIISDNLSTHEGGGVALDDATNVQFLNNTVAANLTTATAVTSDGTPAPAGLSTGRNSIQLQATLAAGRSTFSNPVLRNNLFQGNLAGSWDGTTIHGIGLAGDSSPRNVWDLGAGDGSGTLSPTYSVLTRPNAGQATTSGANVPGTDVPLASTAAAAPFDVLVNDNDNSQVGFVAPYQVSVDVSTLRAFPGFRQSVIVSRNLSPDQLGDFHVNPGSVAVGLGVALQTYGLPWFGAPTGVAAPTTDIEGTVRYVPPATTTKRLEAGADERP